MPDDAAYIRKVLKVVEESVNGCRIALIEPIDSDIALTLRQQMEGTQDRLQTVRDWLDEKVR